MRVEIKTSPDIKEPYAVLYTNQLTPELLELVARLRTEEKVFTAMDGERTVILQPEDIYIV